MTEGWFADVVRIWLSGGWVMVPLLLLAVLLYGQLLQLVLSTRRCQLGRGAEQATWSTWVADPTKADERVRGILEYTRTEPDSAGQIRRRFEEVRLSLLSTIDRQTKFVAMLVAAAPLMGLLGTVIGMLQTFGGISTAGGTETAGVVAAGISEALVTTQTGLSIALPGLFLVMVVRRQRHGIEAQLARLESLTFAHFRPVEVPVE